MPETRNVFANLPATQAEDPQAEEEIKILARFRGARVERIVSNGQASLPGFWYDQDETEWVVVLSGAAGLLFEGEDAPRMLGPGDHVQIPPHVRHRVEWTDAHQPTVWLAVHGE